AGLLVDLVGQGGQDLPGEGVAGQRVAGGTGLDGDVDPQLGVGQVVGDVEGGGAAPPGQQLGARPVDRDPEVVDLLVGELELGRQAGGGGSDDREVGAGRGDLEM